MDGLALLVLCVFILSGSEWLLVVVPGFIDVNRLGGFLVLDDLRSKIVDEGRVILMLDRGCEGFGLDLCVCCCGDCCVGDGARRLA